MLFGILLKPVCFEFSDLAYIVHVNLESLILFAWAPVTEFYKRYLWNCGISKMANACAPDSK